MNEFSRALEQAEKDYTIRKSNRRQGAITPETSQTPVVRLADLAAEPRVLEEKRPEPKEKPSLMSASEGLGDVEEHLVSFLSPTSFEAEQYRALRFIIEQLNKTAELRVIAVTSPSAGDGKTLTAINLAGAIAQSPQVRVLLVESDLRKPHIAGLLGLGRVKGLGLVDAVLDPTISLDDVVQERPPFNISVLPGGPPQLSPYELLKSPRLMDLFEEMRRRYDYIVLDTPPLILFPDTRLLQQYIDGMILIVAAHKTSRKVVEDALSIVDRTKVIGLVFNGDDSLILEPYHSYHQVGEATKRRRWRR